VALPSLYEKHRAANSDFDIVLTGKAMDNKRTELIQSIKRYPRDVLSVGARFRPNGEKQQ